MKEEIKEILNNSDSSTKFKMVDEDGTEKEMNIAGLIEQLLNDNRNLLDYITNLQQENEELKVENEKLTQLWLSSQEKRRKAIKYLKQPYRDNFDYSKSELMEILGDDNE
jgi:acetate kinase